MKTKSTKQLIRVLFGSFMILAGIAHLTFLRLSVDSTFIVMSLAGLEIILGLAFILLRKHFVKLGIASAAFYVILFAGNIPQHTNDEGFFGMHTEQKNDTTTFYDFEAQKLNGETVSMKEYKGNVVIVVNTASKCGLTPQYEGLEDLYSKYKDDGLVILGFPCNQFGNQEPGSSDDIQEFCQSNYGVSFPMFEKIEVNGEGTHPLYNYLKSALPGTLGGGIKWNFTKFIIDRDGNPVKRFGPSIKPETMEETVLEFL